MLLVNMSRNSGTSWTLIPFVVEVRRRCVLDRHPVNSSLKGGPCSSMMVSVSSVFPDVSQFKE